MDEPKYYLPSISDAVKIAYRLPLNGKTSNPLVDTTRPNPETCQNS